MLSDATHREAATGVNEVRSYPQITQITQMTQIEQKLTL